MPNRCKHNICTKQCTLEQENHNASKTCEVKQGIRGHVHDTVDGEGAVLQVHVVHCYHHTAVDQQKLVGVAHVAGLQESQLLPAPSSGHPVEETLVPSSAAEVATVAGVAVAPWVEVSLPAVGEELVAEKDPTASGTHGQIPAGGASEVVAAAAVVVERGCQGKMLETAVKGGIQVWRAVVEYHCVTQDAVFPFLLELMESVG